MNFVLQLDPNTTPCLYNPLPAFFCGRLQRSIDKVDKSIHDSFDIARISSICIKLWGCQTKSLIVKKEEERVTVKNGLPECKSRTFYGSILGHKESDERRRADMQAS